jgi:DNA excision repair protein ERCC-6
MTSRNIFDTLQAAIEEIQQRGTPGVDLVILPPEPDQLTDDEEGENDDIVDDVAGFVEADNRDSSSDEEEDPSPPKKAAHGFDWAVRNPQFSPLHDTSNSIEVRQAATQAVVDHLSPIGIFRLLWRDVNQLFMKYTRKFARVTHNEHTFRIQDGEMDRFFGILLLSGYNSQPEQGQYWERSDDLGVEAVRRAMSKNRFHEIKKYLHVCDNTQVDATDKLFKIRKLIDVIGRNIRQFGVFSKCLSVDESMLPYYGKFGIKMFIKGKPIRFGYKIWCLCDDWGYLYNFEVYCGRQPTLQALPLGTRVVIDLLDAVDTPTDHEVYFDNFFTSPQLMATLREKGFRATGTIRETRTLKAPLTPNRTMRKKPRGHYEVCFDRKHDVCIVKWQDNSSVSIASNFEGPFPLTLCTRWSAKDRRRIQVTQPAVITSYNKHMGGVDKLDKLLAAYRPAIRGKKWYYPFFTHFLNVCVTNAWNIHRRLHPSPLPHLQFRREIAQSLLNAPVVVEPRHNNPGHQPLNPKCT